MIELESGQDGSTLGAVPARGSRSYNYRVVMRKGKRRREKRREGGVNGEGWRERGGDRGGESRRGRGTEWGGREGERERR